VRGPPFGGRTYRGRTDFRISNQHRLSEMLREGIDRRFGGSYSSAARAADVSRAALHNIVDGRAKTLHAKTVDGLKDLLGRKRARDL
jgi:plasmid maintenance system antidote protein VapI